MPLRMWQLAAGVLAYSLGRGRGVAAPTWQRQAFAALSLVAAVGMIPFWSMDSTSLLTLSATVLFTLSL